MNRIETVRVRPDDPAQLLAWLERFNEACNWLSSVAFPRYQRDTNHCIAKRVAAKAQWLCCGIALENLKGIRSRIPARRRQRAQLHNWSFGQLRQFIVYKAARAGVPAVFVDPTNTSRTCPACGHVDALNRRSQANFSCRRCGHAGPADVIAARNIRAWALGDAPMVASARAATNPFPASRDNRRGGSCEGGATGAVEPP